MLLLQHEGCWRVALFGWVRLWESDLQQSHTFWREGSCLRGCRSDLEIAAGEDCCVSGSWMWRWISGTGLDSAPAKQTIEGGKQSGRKCYMRAEYDWHLEPWGTRIGSFVPTLQTVDYLQRCKWERGLIKITVSMRFQFNCVLFKEEKGTYLCRNSLSCSLNCASANARLEITVYIKVVSCLSVNMLRLKLRRQSDRATFTPSLRAIRWHCLIWGNWNLKLLWTLLHGTEREVHRTIIENKHNEGWIK